MYIPYVSEGLGLLAGFISIYLSACGHTYWAVALLVVVFFGRLKAIDTLGTAPLVSDASKLQLLRSLDRETLHELLHDDLPRWVKFPDVEKCEWLNNAIATLWPYVKVALARSVKEALTPVLQGLKPSLMMTDMAFRGLDLGTAAPVINGVKSPQHLEEQVVIDVDLLIATQNTDVVFSFGNSASHIYMNVELSDFLLRGTLRVVMKPLFPRWPTFGAVTISFTEKPTINFHLKTLHLNLMELPALSSLFHNAISSAVESACVWPNKLLIPLVEDLSKVEMESLAANKPLGMLVIQNLRLLSVQPANRASRWTGKFSFHLQLSVGKEKTFTEVVRGQTHFDFTGQLLYLLVVDTKTQDLNMALRYKEAFEKTHTIDAKWIHLGHLERHVPSKEIVDFGREGNGRAEFDLVWYPFSGLSKSQRKKSREAPLPLEIVSMGVVFIKLVKCERLTSMDLNGSSDPYVIFKVGSRKKQSSVKHHTLTPVWDPPEHVGLIVPSDRHDDLLVTVMDYDYLKVDDEIGNVVIPLAQVQRSARFVETWMLENGSGTITLELEWKGF